MANFLKTWRAELKRALTGSPDAVPAWVPKLAEGDDAGYFQPGSATWAVHGSMTTIVAGIRALLMQALHPGALAGVYDHSDFREDPLGRLARTIQWIFTVTYGSTHDAKSASDKVLRLHERVNGRFIDGHGVERGYSANDPELLRWIHIAFTDAFLSTHKVWGRAIPGGPDAYVREWVRAGTLMGVNDAPTSEADMRRMLDKWYDDGDLKFDARVAEVVAFLRRPPLHPTLMPGYRVLFAAAVATLEPKYQDMLGLQKAHLGRIPLPVATATKAVLGIVHLALSRVGPSELAARSRLQRLGLLER
ncbi:oxygenase MpaB family protein [Paenarthrobacter sp. PH39-S1]|uniref:oxygenase MpaB family protein n=1 Tax=Paenarthrobacter sp. PH39-S1 TaxID=3046204 RepID=UPI0024BAF0B6|nr:oxygenase MpaB family protein [Paenarthrobacter sp. PH39-S1]MDJ0354873.1 oxygenase MpaB family protein [Paenarthrobacter sp. PH39-S1]